MRPGASKATVLAKTDDAHDECMNECDSSVDAWRSESALYPDDQDSFASIPMADVHPSRKIAGPRLHLSASNGLRACHR
ncbi:uncharacterized protein ARMOST_02186 [Armillaria ostoyae]|uniref:Uncharacterized protein n=1 Tax=Armillaria ostoyae TaxID=47428 RepID=A0A284QR13_ARMOS|nr:uncharacterized protein ARMOST_02186 [Armillaria ostoyae]